MEKMEFCGHGSSRYFIYFYWGGQLIDYTLLKPLICSIFLPKTTIAPENWPGPKKGNSSSNHPLSGAMLVSHKGDSFRVAFKFLFLGSVVS